MQQLTHKHHTATVTPYDRNSEPMKSVDVSIVVEYTYVTDDPDCGTHVTNFNIIDAATDDGPIEVTDHLAELAFADFIDKGDYSWNQN